MRVTDLLQYARVHRAMAVLAGVTVVAVLSALFGGTRIAVPSFGGAGYSTGIPFRRELPMLSAVFLTAALGGGMATHEELATPRVHRARTGFLAILVFIACGISFVVESLAVGHEGGIVYVRSMLIWFGIALTSIRVFGNQLGWIMPLGSVLPLVWFAPAWWDWTASGSGDPFSWLIVGLSMGVGVTAVAASSWRLQAFRVKRM
ncbi:hypothetical protein ACI2LJ_37605 [Streptomyces sp. NPDC088090]|uniref:hypothetical protein n=1 Tax=Streptomyces sp. NPDC088090 TaxID=3365822 RepID=UPI00384C143A